MNYASGGIGTLNHLLMEQLKAAAGFDAVVAHYRGIAPAIKDILAGVTMMMMPAAPAGYLFGRVARDLSTSHDPAFGFQASFALCAGVIGLGILIALFLLPARPSASD